MRGITAVLALLVLSGISFSANVTGCAVLGTLGESYLLTQDVSGAPNAYYGGAYNACILINASDITFDCQGYSITPGTSATGPTGISLEGNNITVRNCRLNGTISTGQYASTGISVTGATNCTVRGNNITTSNYGLRGLNSPSGCSFIANSVRDGEYGFFATAGFSSYQNNSLDNLTSTAMYLSNDGNLLSGNNATFAGNGFDIGGASNNLSGNRADSAGSFGFKIGGDSNTLTGNYARNVSAGFRIELASYNALYSNSAENVTSGFEIDDTFGGGSYNILDGNTACNATSSGFSVVNSDYNLLNNNTACNNTGDGFYLYNTHYSNLTENSAYLNNLSGYEMNFSGDSRFSGNGAQDNSDYGFLIQESNGINMSGNTASGSYWAGFALFNSNMSRLINNSAANNTDYGYDLIGTNNSLLDGNAAINNSGFCGFYLYSVSEYNNLTNNNAFLNGKGVCIDNTPFNLLSGNNASGNLNDGISIGGYANYNDIINNTACDNGRYGIDLYSSSNYNELINNTVCRNANRGERIMDSVPITLSGEHYYNNSYDLEAAHWSGFSTDFDAYSLVFDNPAGDMQSFTNLTISDILTMEAYTLNWTPNGYGLPPGRVAFREKFVNITNQSGNVSLDSVSWSWNDGELAGFTESRLELWRYAGSWSELNATLNESANSLSISNLVPSSTYGVLQDNQSLCTTPTDNYLVNNSTTFCPGTYYINDSGLPGVIIAGVNATNITCDGTVIIGNGAGYGFNATNRGGVTVSGCTFANYSTGMRLVTVSGLTIWNNSVENSSSVGIYLDAPSSNNNASMNRLSGNVHGVYFNVDSGNSYYNVFEYNTIGRGTNGIYIYNPSSVTGAFRYNNFTGNTVENLTEYGFRTYATSPNWAQLYFENNTFTGNSFANMSRGFNLFVYAIKYVRYNSFYNNTVNNASYGIVFNTSSCGDFGYDASYMFPNTFVNNSFNDISTYAVYMPTDQAACVYRNDFGGVNYLNGLPIHQYYQNNRQIGNLSLNSSWDKAINLGLASIVYSTNTSLRGSNITGGLNHGVYSYENANVTVENNVIFGNGNAAGEACIYDYSGAANTHANNTLSACPNGMTLVETSITAASNVIENMTTYGIYFDAPSSSSNILNNRMRSNPTGILFNVDNGNSYYNVFENNTMSGGTDGIYVYNPSSVTGAFRYNDLTGNVIENITGYGFRTYATSPNWAQLYFENNTFTGNSFANMSRGFNIDTYAVKYTRYNLMQNNVINRTAYGIYVYAASAEFRYNNITNNSINATIYPLYYTDSAPATNSYANTTFINDNASNFIYNPGAATNLTNVTFSRQGASLSFPSEYSLSQSVNVSNTLISQNIVSLNNATLSAFTGSQAGIGLYIRNMTDCPGRVFRKTGFPTNSLDVIVNGTRCLEPDCTAISCDGSYVAFTTASFSGYAAENNTPPDITAPVIDPPSPDDRDNLTASANYTDPDNDSGRVTFYWYVNGTSVFNETSALVPSGTIANSTLLSGNFSAGSYVNVSAQSNDTLNLSPMRWSDTKLITSSCTVPANDYPVNVSTTFCPGTFYINDTGSTGVIIANNNSINLTCDGTILVGNGAGTGIFASQRNGVVIAGCTLVNYSNGIYLYKPYSDTIRNNTALNSTAYGILMYMDGGGDFGRSVISNNTMLGQSGATGLYFSVIEGWGGGHLDYSNITDNNFGNLAHGIAMYINRWMPSSVSFNRFENNTCSGTGTCVTFWGGAGYLTNNSFINNTFRDSANGVWFRPQDWNGRIMNNRFSGNQFNNISNYSAIFGWYDNDNNYRNDFAGANTQDGYPFYHYYLWSNVSLSGRNINRSADATNLGSFTTVDSTNITLEGSNVTGDREYGVFLWNSNGVRITNNSITGNGDSGNEANVYSGYDNSSEVRGNALSGGRIGVYTYSPRTTDSITVADNSIISTASYGILAHWPYYDKYLNNTIRNATTNGIFLYVDGGGSRGYTTIANNTISGPSGGNSIFMQVWEGWGGGHIDYNNVTGNSLGNSTNGIAMNINRWVPSSIAYNRFDYNSCANTTTCVMFYGGGGYLWHNVFNNNTLRNSTNGVYFSPQDWNGRIMYNNFTGNRFYNITSYAAYFGWYDNDNNYRNDFGNRNTLDDNTFYHYYNWSNVQLTGLDINSTADASNLGLFSTVDSTNITISNSSVRGDGEYGVFFWNTANSTVRDSFLSGNGDSGSEGNVYTYVDQNNSVTNNTVSGGYIGVSTFASSYGPNIIGNVIANTSSNGVFADRPNAHRIIDNVFRNNSGAAIQLHSNGGAGYYRDTIVRNNTISGPAGGTAIAMNLYEAWSVNWLSYNNFTDNSIANTAYGVSMYISRWNGGFQYNRFVNTSCANVTACYRWNGVAGNGGDDGVRYNSFINGTVTNATYGISIENQYYGDRVFMNNFSGISVNSTSYPVYITVSGQNDNSFSGMVLETNSGNFIYNPGSRANYTNVTFVRNQGRVNFPQGNVALAKSVNAGNTVLNYDIASINSTALPELAIPANVTTYARQCPAAIYWMAGFPANSAQIVAGGSQCSGPQCIQHTCSANLTTFSVASFSGYTANATNCMVINAPGSYTMNGSFSGAPFSASPLTGNVCIKIAASDVLFDCNGYSITGDGSATTYGILLNGSRTNVTIRNCPAISNYTRGIELFESSTNVLTNLSVSNNTEYGIYLLRSHNNSISNSSATNNSQDGVYLYESSNNTVFNNSVSASPTGFLVYVNSRNNTLDSNLVLGGSVGFDLDWLSSYNTVRNNNASSYATDGFLVNANSDNNSVYNNTASGAAGTYGFHVATSSNNSFANNTARNSQDGFYLTSSPNNLLFNNSAANNSRYCYIISASSNNSLANNTARNCQDGFYLSSSPNNTLAGNSASDNSVIGFLLFASSNSNSLSNNSAYNNLNGFSLSSNAAYNALSNNTAYNNTQYGLTISSSAGNDLSGNSFYNNTLYGIYVLFSANNTLTNNSAYNNTQHGFYLYSSNNTLLSNNYAYNNGATGFYLYSGTNNTIADSMAYSNSLMGTHIISANKTRILNGHYFGNSRDLAISESSGGVPFVVNVSNVIFDSPAGVLQNYTNLSMNDTVSVSSEYALTWASSSAPPGFIGFERKYLNITGNLSTLSIDAVTWHWLDGESGGYNESRFGIWKHNGTWNDMNAALDPSANTLTLINMNPASIYGILQNNLTANVSALKLDQTAAQPSPGGIVRFNMTITNTGNLSLNPVSVVDALPAGLTFSSAAPVPDSVIGQAITWNNISSLAPGGSSVIYMNATVDPGAVNASVPVRSLTNVVNATGTDQFSGNISASSSANVTIYYASVSVLELDQTAAQPSPGGTVQFNLTITNTGNVSLSPVELTDELPAGLTFSSAYPSPDAVIGQSIDWDDVGPLAPGASSVVYLNATVDAGAVNASVPARNLTNYVEAVGVPP
ncbi:MAG: right-handed parallel beta-helix repeat-containing protein, partial [Candidatus Micrarchaeota archaeon]